MSGIPKGWVLTNAIEISDSVRGVSYKKEQAKFTPDDNFTAVLRANNIQGNRIFLDDLVYVQNSNINPTQFLKINDIVIAMSSGSLSVVGKSAQVKEGMQASFGAFCGVLRPTSVIEPRYLGLFLKSDIYRKSISNLARGSNINNLKWSHFEEIPLPLAPLPEQKRIADKLDSVLARVDACRERLARVQPLLKRFRQSVLAAATSGRLTEDWRAERAPDYKSGAPVTVGDLADQAANDQRASTLSATSAAGIEPASVSSNLTDYASNIQWLETDVQSVATVGTGSTPLRSNATFYATTGMPWITSSATGDDFVTVASEFVTEDAIKTHRLKVYPIGTLLVAMYGEGKTRGQVSELAIEATINQACSAVVVDEKKANRAFVKLALQANYFVMRELAEGGNQPNLNLSKIKEFRLHLPSLLEQHEIVRRVETLFAFADRLEARLAAAQGAADKLTPALLAKAFRGELVPQDPNDEPAAELLKRLAAQRAAAPKPKRGRKAASAGD
ncbi:restriction endonuclease subunit S [Chromobacterium violaceum]|uniref:restriction endonuclease subunit S n=1 Tax=Chromobacterium violaceum TaxID=536 RepID=UPI0015FC379A|nr:restriction endonuclease subunit S [Chromobacterium violaceum]MBA8733536.1 restriction endonuclease subunit S [Chromobacterium violaceum]